MRRFDSFNNLIFHTEVNGTMPVPLTTASSVQSIKPYTEKYALGDNKKIYSEGSATYIVDDNSIVYTVSRVVDFETVNNNRDYAAHVEVKDTTSAFYDTNSHLRFRQKYTVTQGWYLGFILLTILYFNFFDKTVNIHFPFFFFTSSLICWYCRISLLHEKAETFF